VHGIEDGIDDPVGDGLIAGGVQVDAVLRKLAFARTALPPTATC
jgi:hypothetical protein